MSHKATSSTQRVALIRTPVIQPSHHISSLRAVPSIGLAYIQAALRNEGFGVTVIDSPGEALEQYRSIRNSRLTVNGLNADEIIARIPADVDAIGFSIMHANEWVYDSYIIARVARAFPAIPIFVGGENATGSCQRILSERPEVKAVVLGEGDIVGPLVVKALLGQGSLEKIRSVAYRNPQGKIEKTSRLLPVTQPSRLSWPDWTGIPLEKYFEKRTSISVHNQRSMTMLATRGCPHTCSFCTVPEMWNSKWHSRDPQDVVDEMKSYIEKYKVEHFDFVDLTFALNKNWTKEFCHILLKEKLNIKWSLPIGTRVEALDNEILELMRAAGCQRVLYSPESGSKLTLLRIKKKLKIENMEDVIRKSVQVGLVVKLATIFGFPGQTLRELLGTYLFILKAALIGVHDVVCLSFIPYPGTELYDELVAEGKFDPDKEPVRLNNDIKSMVSWSESIPSSLMSTVCAFGMMMFYGAQFTIRPWRIFVAFKNIFYHRQPQTNFESLIYCAVFRKAVDLGSAEDLTLENVDISKPVTGPFVPHQIACPQSSATP